MQYIEVIMSKLIRISDEADEQLKQMAKDDKRNKGNFASWLIDKEFKEREEAKQKEQATAKE